MNMRRAAQLAGCVILAAATAATATTLKRMELAELAASARVVARLRALDSTSRFERGEIWTFTRFAVVETLKGSAPPQMTVRLIGGRAGHLVSTVDGVPRFADGEEVVLFLEPTASGEMSVTGWAQGTFRIRTVQGRESVTQDTGGLSIFDPVRRELRPGGVRHLPMEEFRARVAAAVAQSERRLR